MATAEKDLPNLPEDNASLKAMLRSLLAERDREKQRADDLHIQNLRLQLELARVKKMYYGPRADRLNSTSELAQVLLDFGQELEQRPIHPDDVPPASEPEYELRRVKRRKGRRSLANFENLPVTTQVYELSAEERICPTCEVVRQESGTEESWQIEYIPGHFERIHHVRKKYACVKCERSGEAPQMTVAARPTSWPASSPITFRCIGWKTFLLGRVLRFRGPPSRCGAAMWPIWSSHCIGGWQSECDSRMWWLPTTPSCRC
jgi:hypothetical protein